MRTPMEENGNFFKAPRIPVRDNSIPVLDITASENPIISRLNTLGKKD